MMSTMDSQSQIVSVMTVCAIWQQNIKRLLQYCKPIVTLVEKLFSIFGVTDIFANVNFGDLQFTETTLSSSLSMRLSLYLLHFFMSGMCSLIPL